jgi:hypothetical protein
MSTNGVLEGTVADDQGRPVSRAAVGLRLESPADAERPYYQRVITDAMGRYAFRGLPPGRYVVGVNIDRGPSQLSPFTMTLATQGVDGTASAVGLDPGERRSLLPIVVARLAPVRVTGRAVQPDGRPVASVRLTVRAVAEGGRDAPFSTATTDADGRFVLSLLRSAAYTIGATAGGDRVPFVAGSDALVITLRDQRQ